jgi:hypothetical protein
MDIKFNSINELKAAIEAGKIKTPRFVSFRNYPNKQGEISNYLVNLGVNHKHLLEEDLIVLSFLSTEDFDFPEIAQPYATKAYDELITSLTKNVSDDKEDHTTASKAQLDTYTTVLPNVKVHNETGEVYITGHVIRKTVIQPGEYKPTNKRPKTIAKDVMRKIFKTSKYRQFILKNIQSMRINGLELIIE